MTTLEEMDEAAASRLEEVKAIVAKGTENYIGGPKGCPSGEPGVEGPPGLPGVRVLTKEELLEVENLSLRIQLLASNRTNYVTEATRTLEGIDGQLKELREKVTAMQNTLSAKYGIDFRSQQIEAVTGRVIPAPPQT